MDTLLTVDNKRPKTMRMEYGLIFIIVAILAGAMTGATVTVWGLKLQILRLETTVDGLQDRLSSFAGRDLAKARWTKRDAEQALLLSQMRPNQRQPAEQPFTFPSSW